MDAEAQRLAEAEDKALQERERANRARQIMEDPLFRDAVQSTRDQLHRDFAKSDLDDDRKRLVARIGINVLENVLTVLNKHMETGKFAEETLSEIDRKKTLRDRFKRVS